MEQNVFETTKISIHFGQNVWKYRLMNIAAASFITTVRQMTEMFQWPKCLSKKWPKCLRKKSRYVVAGNFIMFREKRGKFCPKQFGCNKQLVVVAKDEGIKFYCISYWNTKNIIQFQCFRKILLEKVQMLMSIQIIWWSAMMVCWKGFLPCWMNAMEIKNVKMHILRLPKCKCDFFVKQWNVLVWLSIFCVHAALYCNHANLYVSIC